MECEVVFEKTHSMLERLTDCYECNQPQTLKRIPSSFRFINGNKRITGQPVSGQVVKDHIEKAKEEVRQQKEDMMREQ